MKNFIYYFFRIFFIFKIDGYNICEVVLRLSQKVLLDNASPTDIPGLKIETWILFEYHDAGNSHTPSMIHVARIWCGIGIRIRKAATKKNAPVAALGGRCLKHPSIKDFASSIGAMK